MTMDRDSRVLRVVNVVILLGSLLMVTLMMATPREGPSSFFKEWLGEGAIWFLIGAVLVAWRAPRYISGGQRP